MYNGLALLIDDESGTYWDHITGAAVYGPWLGYRLENWAVSISTVAAALAQDPDLEVSVSSFRSIRSFLIQLFTRRQIHTRGWLPPFFRWTMGSTDPRLPEMTQGLGVVVGHQAKYYPLRWIPAGGISEAWGQRSLAVKVGPYDGVPYAEWTETGERPFQLLSRWYGFSLTYPDCEIYLPSS